MIDAILYIIYALLLVVVVLTLWSALRRVRITPLMIGVSAGLIVLLLLTYFLADTTPLMINGQEYADLFWLRVSDMLIWTSIVLMIVAIAGVVICEGVLRCSNSRRK